MSKSKDMSFLDHLEELRWHLIRSVISILIFGFIAFLAKEIIFDIIIFGPKKGDFISYKLFCSISSVINSSIELSLFKSIFVLFELVHPIINNSKKIYILLFI